MFFRDFGQEKSKNTRLVWWTSSLGNRRTIISNTNLDTKTFKRNCSTNRCFRHKEYGIENIQKDFFDDFDLIIDATGKFEVAQYLNEIVNEQPKEKQIPILHLWIFANGECVQAFWNDSKILSNNGGCHHCLTTLWDNDPKSYYPLKDTSREATIRVSRPCSNYTPYSVSSSLNVVGLAIEILLAWKANNLNNNYFTSYAPTSLASRNDDLENKVFKQANCLICK